MAISSVNSYTSGAAYTASTASKTETEAKSTDTKAAAEKTGVVYEKSSASASSASGSKVQNSALIAQLKADSNNRIAQLQGIVEQMMSKQGSAIGKADSMWSFLASGDFTVDAATKAQAQADIAEDGYWGVNQTSDRILDFAKALSGNDKSKAEELINAFKKGYEQATKAWGKTLPDISKKTYDAVLDKFDQWVNGED
ncbi:MAG: hypothetical protein IJ567_00535 [Lachnospiraceae bacterium]|nr:hypothetical protein [Lachnospiraceae bacterium]